MFVLAPASRRSVAPSFGRVFDRLFDDPLDRVFGRTTDGAAPRTPALDVTETDAAYTVAFEVPGVSRDQLKVSVEGRRITLDTVQPPAATAAPEVGTEVAGNAEHTASATADQPKPATPRVLYRERAPARYARTVSLPAEVDQAASQARFENGVLTLTLAKKVPTAATQLSID